MDRYHYIIAGAGAAGLSLLMHLLASGKFPSKRILLIDREPKTKNDRTWCFWEKENGLFDPIVFRSYDDLWFHNKKHSALHHIAPYRYKLVRGIDFYNYCFSVISSHANVDVKYADVEKCVSDGSGTYIIAGGRKIEGEYIFNSILFHKPALVSGRSFLWQHFKGWVVEAPQAAFNVRQATLMDFRVPQADGNTTFVYVMPFSDSRALVEYTIFSKNVWSNEQYDHALGEYCAGHLRLGAYNILESESGAIPMTDHTFAERINNIVNIGTAGGQTKPSSGYTFHFIQEHSRAIVRALTATGRPFTVKNVFHKRFELYDRTLLHILARHSLPGEKVFSILMESNKMSEVFKFLDNKTSFFEELRIIRQLPKAKFLRAALNI